MWWVRALVAAGTTAFGRSEKGMQCSARWPACITLESKVRFSYVEDGDSYVMQVIELKSLRDVQDLLITLIKKGNFEDSELAIKPETDPLKDIKGFDSLNVLEVLTEFEDKTGLHFEDDIFYVDLDSKDSSDIAEIASAIWAEIKKGG